ncbi:MAG TPA: IreB family regulatory phosphoprotein [Clostridiales bacterium]|nr:IreB family regulatory phosphoprotein [Clostridiales bacterium]
MSDRLELTKEFAGNKDDVSSTVKAVFEALQEKGYNASNQIVGYLISGDPSYITSHKDARNLIQNIERDDLMEVFVSYYLEHACK